MSYNLKCTPGRGHCLRLMLLFKTSSLHIQLNFEHRIAVSPSNLNRPRQLEAAQVAAPLSHFPQPWAPSRAATAGGSLVRCRHERWGPASERHPGRSGHHPTRSRDGTVTTGMPHIRLQQTRRRSRPGSATGSANAVTSTTMPWQLEWSQLEENFKLKCCGVEGITGTGSTHAATASLSLRVRLAECRTLGRGVQDTLSPPHNLCASARAVL
jgi:hypothetical protein